MPITYGAFLEKRDNNGEAAFYFLIREAIPDDAVGLVKDGVKYDSTKYLIKVLVREEDGQLVPELPLKWKLEPAAPSTVRA